MVKELNGEVIAMGTGGSLELATRSRDLLLTFSDGLRSVTRRVRIPAEPAP
jgi:hypothetical protein